MKKRIKTLKGLSMQEKVEPHEIRRVQRKTLMEMLKLLEKHPRLGGM